MWIVGHSLRNKTEPDAEETEDEQASDDPGEGTVRGRLRIQTLEDSVWLFTLLKRAFGGGRMRYEANPTVRLIMNCIVIHVQGQAHDEEGLLPLSKQQYTNGSILKITDINHILFWLDTDPFVSKHEVEYREVVVALGHNIPGGKLIFITLHLAVHLD